MFSRVLKTMIFFIFCENILELFESPHYFLIFLGEGALKILELRNSGRNPKNLSILLPWVKKDHPLIQF